MMPGADVLQETRPQEAGQVQIVERHDDYTVLEVTCSCGSKIYVRCEHG